MKDLKRKAAETRQPLPIPAEANGITVDCYNGAAVVSYGRPATYISPRRQDSEAAAPNLPHPPSMAKCGQPSR